MQNLLPALALLVFLIIIAWILLGIRFGGGRTIILNPLLWVRETVRAEDQIRKLTRAIEQSGNSIVITDTQGNIEYVNPKFEQVTGYSLEEVRGKNPRILKSGKQRTEFYEKMWATISSGEVWHGVFNNKRKDGSLYWESATIAPVLDHQNVVVNYVAIKEDITARREAESQLRKLSRAVEQSGNTVVIMDREGLIEYVNPKFTEVTGYTAEEALGKATAVLMKGMNALNDFHDEEWWKDVNAGRNWHGEFQNRRKDGSVFWESATIAPILNRDGEVTNFVEIKQDITEQKLLQEQIQKQNDYLSVLHQMTLDLLNRRRRDDLLQLIVDRSARLLNAPFSELMLEKDGMLVVEAVTGEQTQLLGEQLTREQAKLSWQAFDTHRPAVLEDYSTWEHRREIYEEFSLYAVADFPVMAGDKCLGVLALGRTQPDQKFTAEQIEFGILFARLTALVLDNANLYESALMELAERRRMEEALFTQNQYLGILHKTTIDLIQSQDSKNLLNLIAARSAEIVGASYGYIYLSEGDDLVLRAANHEFADRIGSRERKPGSGVLASVWQNMKPVIVDDYSQWEGHDPSYKKWRLKALAGVPIIGKGGPIGVLEVARLDNDPGKFTPQEIEVFVQLASLVSVVLYNAQLYDQALEASRFKSQLVSRVSHELRTPLGGILGYAELLQYKAFGEMNEQQQNAIANIIESTHYLTNTVNDLLDQSQIDANTITLDTREFETSRLIERSRSFLSVLAGKKGLDFSVEVSPEFPKKLRGDE